MRKHVAAWAPLEACGLLAGVGQSVQEVFLITNSESSPVRFRMDAVEQLRAFGTIEDRGMELLGIFHSHPADPQRASRPADVPSPTDIREAAYPVVHVIWSRRAGEWSARGFWIEDGRISEVLLQVTAAE